MLLKFPLCLEQTATAGELTTQFQTPYSLGEEPLFDIPPRERLNYGSSLLYFTVIYKKLALEQQIRRTAGCGKWQLNQFSYFH